MKYTRREACQELTKTMRLAVPLNLVTFLSSPYLIIVVTPALISMAGCGGSGNKNESETISVLDATRTVLGYNPIPDGDRELNGHTYIGELRKNGKTLMKGDLQFTVNGFVLGDGEETSGDKSVESLVKVGDIIAWRQR